MFSRTSKIIPIVISLVLITLSCSKDSSTEPLNNAPEIQSVAASPSTIEVNETTNLSCVATDKDGDELTIIWSSENGSFPNGVSGSSVTWKSPEMDGSNTIEVNVSDGKEAATETLDISVIESTESGGEPCPDIPTLTYEGKVYNTVLIGEQCWLKENLNVGTRINSNSSTDHQTDNGIVEKYCYDNDPNNCEKYGGLYQWKEAMKYIIEEGTQGICPDGWHLPKATEFEILANTVEFDGNSLKALEQGSGDGTGTNTSGFSALLAGRRDDAYGQLLGLDRYAYFWSSYNSPNYCG